MENIGIHYLYVDSDFKLQQLSNDPSQYHIDLKHMITEVTQSVSKNKELGVKLTELENTSRKIYILFLESKQLADIRTFQNLSNLESGIGIRPISDSYSDSETNRNEDNFLQNYIYHPIVAIGLEDIITLFSEEKKDAEAQNKYLYDLHFDPRLKFWDSSIWHRYVPVYPNGSTFKIQFAKVLKQICQYHKNWLYYTNAARATLEFQLRILQNSYIAKFGDQGHAEVVTPFKFHSETQMEEKANRLRTFPFQLNTSHLKWRLLLIDDYANRVISSLFDKCSITKKELLTSIVSKDINIGDKIELATENKNHDNLEIVKESRAKLSEGIYDIILLDYLLSYNKQLNRREYGHDLIRELIWESENADSAVKRGPLGKHWIVPISSFPFAFIDKLQQLGITYADDKFRISVGGDPICTPHFFRYNLLKVCKEQVDECILYPERLRRMAANVEKITFQNGIFDYPRWAKIMRRNIQAIEVKKEVLVSDQNMNSAFAESVRNFFREKKSTKMFSGLLDMLKMGSQWNHNVQFFEEIAQKWKEVPKPEIFEAILHELWIKTENYVKSKETAAIAHIDANFQMNEISLIGYGLEKIPDLLFAMPKLEKLNLSTNKLKFLSDDFDKLKKLEELNLSHNQFNEFPSILSSLKTKLDHLNMSGNKALLLDEAIVIAKDNKEVQVLIESGSLEKVEHRVKNAIELLRKGELKKVIDILQEFIIEVENEDIETQLMGIEGRFSRVKKNFQNSYINREDHDVQMNNIQQALFSICKDLE